MLSCVHLAFHARTQDFRQGGPGQSNQKSPHNIFRGGGGGGGGGGPTFSRGSNCLYPIETHLTCDFPGGSGGGGPTFSRGSNCLYPIETHLTCDFPGGPG